MKNNDKKCAANLFKSVNICIVNASVINAIIVLNKI